MYNHSLSNIIILLMSLLYALLVGLGLYGYGMDYYGAYTKGFQWNIDRVNILNYVGFRIVTFTIFGIYVGVYITTFILTLSTGFLIKYHMKLKQSFSFILFLSISNWFWFIWFFICSTSPS